MKRKFIIIALFSLMFLSIIGVVATIFGDFEILKGSLLGDNSLELSNILKVYGNIVLLLACWFALFIIYLRAIRTDKSFNVGKKDSLTGIGNRNYLEKQYKNFPMHYTNLICVAYFSFKKKDFLKCYNENLFNELLKNSAKALQKACYTDDVVARVSESSFAMLIPCNDGIKAQDRVLEIVDLLNRQEHKLLYELVAPFRCGFSLYDNIENSFNTVLYNSQMAYKAACTNKNHACIFTESMVEKNEANDILKNKLLKGIKDSEFQVFLQLIRDVKTGKFVSAEALSRWNSSTEGFVMPSQYIKDMHTTGVIETFDMYMLEKICSLLQDWSNDPLFKDMSVSCNVTRVTISSVNFADNFKAIANKYKFNHNMLIIEITEDALINNQTIAYRNISACKEEGYQISLDDFGAGNSSFSDINIYPIDQIKIDRQFIALASSKRGISLLEGLIDMAHKLDISVVCEGVETKKQNDIVTELNTDLIQGHFYSYVYPVKEAKKHYLASLENI